MRIHMTGVRLKCTMQAFEDAGLDLTVVRNPGNGQIETVAIWTKPADDKVAGRETGIIRRGFGAFSPDCDVILETDRLEPDTVGTIVAKLAATRT